MAAPSSADLMNAQITAHETKKDRFSMHSFRLFRALLRGSIAPLCGIVICLVATAKLAAESFTVAKSGDVKALIYVQGPLADQPDGRWGAAAPNSPATYRGFAVNALQYHLTKMTGDMPEVVVGEEGDTPPAGAIVLGAPAVKLGATPTETSASREGYRLLTRGGRLLIGGESDQAVMHGVHALLRSLGCDWVMPGEVGEVIPQRATIVIDLDTASAPDFPSRRLWYRGYPNRKAPDFARMAVWLTRQQAGVWTDTEGSAAGHVWNQLIRKHKAVFDANPDMYALRRDRNGDLIRSGPQVESTHPKVVELFVNDIRAAYEKNIAAGKWTKDTPASFGIGPADGLSYSLSAESMLAGSGRMDPIVGEVDRTDELILLGNRILEKILPEYPHVYLGFYSYSVHADYPKRYKPHPNITQIFAPINFSRFHSVLDVNSKTQSYYLDVVNQWADLAAEQGNKLYYRGYNWNLAENMMPYTKVRIWGEELPFYLDKGFVGLNVEATKQWGALAASDYVFMRLGWDTSLDWRDLLREFCEAAYGDAADAMEQFNLKIINRQHGAGMEAGSYHAFNVIYDDAFVADAKSLLANATKAAKTDVEKTRISYAAYPIEALELYLAYFNAAGRFDFVEAKKQYDAMMAHFDAAYEENPDVPSNEQPQYLQRFMARFVDAAVKYSTGDYRMVHALPEQMITMFDPNDVGHRMRFQSPEINDSHFLKTHTYLLPWDAQGLAGMRDTAVWYRDHFTLPADAKDQPIGLFIGGVEDEARVWINGVEVGTSGRGFSLPFVFDLTEGVNYAGENVLAIQVVRNSKANEIGLGGLIRPSFLFAGPQLETKAPKPLNLGRVLPGGGEEPAPKE